MQYFIEIVEIFPTGSQASTSEAIWVEFYIVAQSAGLTAIFDPT
jgi:hypothetical protein